MIWIFVLSTSALQAQILINEIHYAPANKTVPEEFIEILNTSDETIDLSGWSLQGVRYTFPDGTEIEAGEYLVIGQDPATITNLYSPARVLGPFEGRISNSGETITLRDNNGLVIDRVNYQRGFPWPIAGGDEGFSIELIHPDLDNDLGGSWRISNPGQDADIDRLIDGGSTWKYFKGTEEPSSPTNAWRNLNFDDDDWLDDPTPMGYGEQFIVTELDDMRGGYSTIYFRHEFHIEDLAEVPHLVLEMIYDDGFNAWINGEFVINDNVDGIEQPFDATASRAYETREFEPFPLPSPTDYLVQGTNVLTIQILNSSFDRSSDGFFDARLTASSTAGSGPTPGRINSVFNESEPPQLRQVDHTPESPKGGEDVIITAKATDEDGVSSMVVEYQVVRPGNYIRLSDPGYETGWTPVPMSDDGQGPDETANDDVYSATIPGAENDHRNLIRYRIRAEDGTGNRVSVPYSDDPQPNFAYFVYDGVPDWRGASRPGVTANIDFGQDVLNLLPIYHLIANQTDVINSQYNSGFDGRHMFGTLVYDGEVYDHIEFENRGEFSTYQSGKNKWRFHINRAHEFKARDNYGRRYRTTWRTMNFACAASPWVPTNRGMAALDETFAFKVYELAGVPSPKTNYVHFRVVDNAVETSTSSQYEGDLWGLFMTIEHTDGAFLDERGLPDGNTYKIEGGGGDKRNQGPTQVASSADYNSLKSGYGRSQPISWWRSNVNLPVYFSFRSVNRAVNNMDLREGWNICQYHNPETGQWSVIPWDLDMLYMPVTHWSGVMNFQNCLTQHSLLAIEYRNRARELSDLLFNVEQTELLTSELKSFVSPPGWDITFADLDQAMWNHHPRTRGGHVGAFYRNPSNHGARGGNITRRLVSADHEGMAEWIESFTSTGYGKNFLGNNARDNAIPETPTITYVGLENHPADGLVFMSSDFDDPQGSNSFGALKWRLSEITPDSIPPGENRTIPRKYEITSTWESEEITTFDEMMTLPLAEVRPGATYRVRVRHKDSSQRWSHWSTPIEFVASEPTTLPSQAAFLRVSEVHYNPPPGLDIEFIEIQNTGPEPLDLTEVRFSDGVEFDFSESEITTLAPDEVCVVVDNRVAFEAFYKDPDIKIAGQYKMNLANSMERIALSYGEGVEIHSFEYFDTWYPSTDDQGHTLMIIDPYGPKERWNQQEGWMASPTPHGTPGYSDADPPSGGFQKGGDLNQDSHLDIGDAVSLLLGLFRGDEITLPCEGNTVADGGNLVLVDFDGNSEADITDALGFLNYLFLDGPEHTLGTSCIRIEGCPSACRF